MYLFAHAFAGCLIGLLFSRISHDPRVFPVCIAGAVLPDIIDKPLALLNPAIFGSSRTVGHTLLFLVLILLAGLFLWRSRDSLFGMALACAVFSHQVLDTIWNLPGIWYFPLLGMFPVILVPDYVSHSFWLELTSPSELVFAGASVVLLADWYTGIGIREDSQPLVWERQRKGIHAFMAVALVATGTYLLLSGLLYGSGTILAPAYSSLTSIMAGLMALCGAGILLYGGDLLWDIR